MNYFVHIAYKKFCCIYSTTGSTCGFNHYPITKGNEMAKIMETDTIEAYEQDLFIEQENHTINFVFIIRKDTEKQPIAIEFERLPDGKKKILETSEESLEKIVGETFDDAIDIVNYVIL
jgi:hypothetical protein